MRIFILFALVIPIFSWAQSLLPPCGEYRKSCFGTWTSASGWVTYTGEYNQVGVREGWGQAIYQDGRRYFGQWINGNFEGRGVLYLPDESKYVGEFKRGRFEGRGVLYGFSGGTLKQGIWRSDQLIESLDLEPTLFPFDWEARMSTNTPQLESNRFDEPALEDSALSAANKDIDGASIPVIQQDSMHRANITAYPKNPRALVIGNGAYRGSARLINPVNDANAIAKKLSSIGFMVTLIKDADRQRLVSELSQFRKDASDSEMTILFYSGHGVQVDGVNYILPVDINQSDPTRVTIEGVRLNEVLDKFLPGKTKIVFLDACRDNPLQRTGDRSVSRGLAPISVAQGTLISYATKDGQTASDGTGQRNSPFTKALLQHLDDPQDIAVILRKVREKVMKATGGKQQPWEYGSLTGGELILSAIRQKEN